MKIQTLSCHYAPNFGDRILNDNNKQQVENLKAKLKFLNKNGIPIGDCFYKIPEDNNGYLVTKDKKFRASFSCWGNNLIVSQRLKNDDLKKVVIEPDGNVFFTEAEDDFDIEEVKAGSKTEKTVNNFLKTVLPKFL